MQRIKLQEKLIRLFFIPALLIINLLASSTSSAQTIVFEETFDEVDGSTSGVDNTGGINWNATCPDCLAGDYHEILAGQLENNDSNGPAIFTSDAIPTSCDNIEICFDINLVGTFEGCFTGSTGCNSTDFVALSYSIDGGPFQNPSNSYDCPVSCAGLFVVWDGNAGGSFTYCSGLIPAGTDIVLQITSQTWSGTEYIGIDNLTVTCYCTAPTLLITDPAPVCETSTIDLTNPAITAGSDAGNLTYWTDASATIALATPTAVGAGTYYIQLEDGGCTSIEPVTMTTFPEDLPTFDPIANVCQNDPAPVLPTTSTNGYTGTWAPAVSTAIPGTTTYTFTPDAGQCASNTTLDITVDAPIIPTFNPIANVCQNDPAPVLPTTSTNGYTGTWAPAVSTAIPGTTTYTFTPDAGQCATSTTLDITVDAPTTPTFNPIANVCQNDPAPVLPTTSTNGFTGTWGPAISTATVGTTAYTFTPDAGQCATSTTLDITVDAPTTPTFNPIANVCQNDPVPVLPATSTNGFTGTWAPAVSTTTSGTTTYTFTPDGGQCATSTTLDITVDPQVTPTFNPVVNVCQNDPAPVLPTTSTNGYTGTWAPVVSTATAGTTTYTFTPDGGQCATSTTLDITVDPQVAPTFNPIANVCQNDPAPVLPTTSTNGFTGTWAPAVSTATAGTTTYTFTPDGGQCATSTTLDITVDPEITPTFDPITNVCQGSPAPVLPTTSTNGITGSWAPAVSTVMAGTTTYTFTPDGGQCATNTTLNITVEASSSVDPGINGAISSCPNDLAFDLYNSLGGTPDLGGTWTPALTSGTGIFDPTIDAFGTYTYTVGSGACSASADIIVTLNSGFNDSENVDVCENTNYTYPDGTTELILASTSHTSNLLTVSGCDSIIITNVTMIPSPTVIAGNDTTICEGQSITLSGSGASTFTWDNSVTDGVSFVPTATTTYTVIGTDQNGCFSGDQITVTIEPLHVVSFEADTLFGCAPLTVNFTNTTPNTSDCEWIINGATVTGCTPQYTYNAGLHSVTLTTTSTTGCSAYATYADYINVSLNPTASFFTSSNEVSTFDSEILFNNTSENATSYEWNFGDNTSSTEENPIHEFETESAVNYSVQLVAYTDLGCTDTAYAIIESIEELIYYIPNTFTPDGDEFNQVFEPIFTQGYDPYDVDFYIYNRWGELIWESHNTDLGWDGTFRGFPVKSDTYTWKVEFKSSLNDERMMDTGHVNLLR